MQIPLTAINQNEVLLYLGDHGQAVPDTLRAAIGRAAQTVLATVRPRAAWRVFSLGEDLSLAGTGLRLEGQDLRALLRDCGQVVLMAATLGAEADRLLQQSEVRDLAEAVILDACCNSAIETVCDTLCASLPYPHLTDRFSPGYGDFPLSVQPQLCGLLDTARQIGLTVSRSGLLLPRKSVTAVLGVADRPQTMRLRGCAHCNLFETCALRKENKTCGKI